MYPEIILCAIALLWSGMILGISFLDSWVKFKTPTLDKSIGFDIGRTVFRFFHIVQALLLIIILIAGVTSYFLPRYWLFLLSIALILIIQALILFPRLSKRVTLILSGSKLNRSWEHSVYGLLEILKLIILLVLGMMIMISLCSLD